MMKKFYYLLMVMLMASVSVGFASCGDENDEPESSDIVGTWRLNNLNDEEGSLSLFQFAKDGNFHEVFVHNKDHEDWGFDVEHGTYTVSGNKLTITKYLDNYDIEIETIKCTYQVKGDQLKITNIDTGYSSTSTRVRDSVIEPYL